MNRLFVCLALFSLPCSLFAQEENSSENLIAVRIAILESNGDLQLREGENLSAAGLNDLIARLRKQETLERYQFFNFAAIENRPSIIHIGREEAVVSGRTFTPTRGGDNRGFAARVSNTYQMRQTGSEIQVVSKVRDDGKIVMELEVECSRLKAARTPDSEASDESRPSTDITPPAVELIRTNTALLLSPGVSTIIEAGAEDGDGNSSRAYIIVSATVK